MTPIEAMEPDFSDDVAGRLADESSMGHVLEALAGLSRADQEVIALCLWQGLAHEAVAVALDVPVGTVKSRLSRARARARAKLSELETPTACVKGAGS